MAFTMTQACDRSELLTDTEPLELELVEALAPKGGQLQLALSTERIYDCANYTIDIELENQTESVNVKVNGIQNPGSCIGSRGVASNSVAIGAENAVYNFRLKQGDHVSEGVIRVTDTHYYLDMSSEDMLTVLRNELVKVPANLYWGVVTEGPQNNKADWERFLEDIGKKNGIVSPSLTQGVYSYFTINAGNQLSIEGFELASNQAYFFMSYPAGTADLESVLNVYGLANFRLEIFSWDGVRLTNSL